MGLSVNFKFIIISILYLLSKADSGYCDSPGLGEPLPAAEARAAVSIVFPDGTGLPAGRGLASDGERLFAARCVACHGPAGRGGLGGELAGGDPDLTRDYPDQTIATYWPYATTLFDFIRRAMPMDAPWSLDDADVYALTAYLLSLDGLWPAGRPLDAAGLANLRLPNRDGFYGAEAHWGAIAPARGE